MVPDIMPICNPFFRAGHDPISISHLIHVLVPSFLETSSHTTYTHSLLKMWGE
jgi:hypothetical protein